MRNVPDIRYLLQKEEPWPALVLEQWKETYDMLHLWTQMVGKIKLELSPFLNHWWNVTLFPSASGLTTGLIPYKDLSFEMEFDFMAQCLFIRIDDGRWESLSLRSGTIAEFYHELKEKLEFAGIDIHIWPVPVEMEDRLPFPEDRRERNYDPDAARNFWKCLVQASKVLHRFRSDFKGKASPVHFFWGGFDLALTFFSGKGAPEHPGVPNVGRNVMVEAYNSELASFGFWGGEGLGEAAFYSYAYPEPENYRNSQIKPGEAFYHDVIREFILPYSDVRTARHPEKIVLEFYKTCFKAARSSGSWKGLI